MPVGGVRSGKVAGDNPRLFHRQGIELGQRDEPSGGIRIRSEAGGKEPPELSHPAAHRRQAWRRHDGLDLSLGPCPSLRILGKPRRGDPGRRLDFC